MENIGIHILVALIKFLWWLYDIVTFPVYYFLQQPWDKVSQSSELWAKPVKEDDLYSPYVQISRAPKRWEDIQTLDQLFRKCVTTYGVDKCFGTREVLGEENEIQKDGKVFKKLILGDYKWMSFNEANHRVDQLCCGLMELEVQPKENICVFAETRVEWMLIAQACFRINVPIVTLTPTVDTPGIVHGINQTGVKIVVTSQELLPKLQKIFSEIPNVSTIIYMESKTSLLVNDFPDSLKLLPFSDVEAMGTISDPGQCGEPPGPDDIAIIMYTSGSTGIPKGVIILHKNIVTTWRGIVAVFSDLSFGENYIAYLPLAHVLELISEFSTMSYGMAIGFSSPGTLTDRSTSIKEGCSGDATLLKPAFMTAVPLILSRIQKSVLEIVESHGMLSKAVFEFAMQHKLYWIKKGYLTPLTDRLIFSTVRNLVGGNLQNILSGGAPLNPDTHDFVRACLCNSIGQGYGLTETGAGGTLTLTVDMSTGNVGPPLPGLYIKLIDWDEGNYHVTDTPNPRGEIVVGGDSVTAGYYDNVEATEEAFMEEGGIRWFYTGDIGEILPNGSIAVIATPGFILKSYLC